MRNNKPDLWKKCMDSASRQRSHLSSPSHNAFSVKQFLADKRIPSVLEYPPYFPDLALCDIYLFPKVKTALK